MIEGYNRDNIAYFNMLGEKLRLAREAQGLQVSDIAKQLFISKQRIIEIEKGDYSNVVSPLYLRWYLRSYAKIVGLPDYEISNEINEFINSNDVQINTNLMIETQKNYEISALNNKAINSKKSSWFYTIFFLSLFLVAFLYFMNKERDRQHIQGFVNSVVSMFGLSNGNVNE